MCVCVRAGRGEGRGRDENWWRGEGTPEGTHYTLAGLGGRGRRGQGGGASNKDG